MGAQPRRALGASWAPLVGRSGRSVWERARPILKVLVTHSAEVGDGFAFAAKRFCRGTVTGGFSRQKLRLQWPVSQIIAVTPTAVLTHFYKEGGKFEQNRLQI